MKLSEIIGMSARQIRTLGSEIKQKLYTNLRRSVTQRGKAFERKGLKQKAPKSVMNLPSFKNASEKQINEALSMAETYLTGNIYTAAGFEEYISESKQMWGERLGYGRPLTKAEYDRFGRYMGDMQERTGANWQHVSSQAAQLFAEALRLNLNPDQFKRNFDYWSDHVDKLKNARPIDRPSGVKPSDYIRQLKLETITSWKNKS